MSLTVSKLTTPWRANADDDDAQYQGDSGLALAPAKPKLRRPPLYKVVLLNDDYTPMEFVVEILERFFRMNREKATHIMLAVHTQGKGVWHIPTRYRRNQSRASQSTCQRQRTSVIV